MENLYINNKNCKKHLTKNVKIFFNEVSIKLRAIVDGFGFYAFFVVYVCGETGMMIALSIMMDSKGDGFRNNRSWLYARAFAIRTEKKKLNKLGCD